MLKNMRNIILILLLITTLIVPIAVDAASDKTDIVILKNPLAADGGPITPNQLIGQIINGVLGIVGSLALVMFIYGVNTRDACGRL